MKRLTTLAILILSVAACNLGPLPPPKRQEVGGQQPTVTEVVPSQPEEQQPPAPTTQPTLPHTQPSDALAAPEYPAILLTVDATPGGETIHPLLGVNAGPLPASRNPDYANLTEQYHAIGVTLIRAHDYGGPLDMATMYPDQSADPHDPASYDFTASDQVFAAIVQGGFEPYLRLGDSFGVTPGFPPAEPRAPTNPRNWVQAAVEVVRHYDELSRQAGVPLRYVEIWNEPNFRQFWDAAPREFYDLFVKAASALKAEFPHLMIGGPGMASGGSLTPETELYAQRFLDYLQQHKAPLDFFSWHVYASDAETYVQLAAFYRQQLDAHGYTGTESHITEWNTSMQDAPGQNLAGIRNTSRGAALMTAAWIGLQQRGVAVSTFYRGNDSAKDQTDPAYYGLFHTDGRAKPIALAFSLWAEMAAHPQRLSVTLTGSDAPNRLWVLAGQNENGEIALLIANPNDTPTSWEAIFPGNDAAENASLTVQQVSDASDEMQVFTLEEPRAEIRAYTVQLVILKPSQTAAPPVQVTAASPTPPPRTATPTIAVNITPSANVTLIPIGEASPDDPAVKPLLGVISGPDPNAGFTQPNLAAQYQKIGVLSVRNNDYYDDRLDLEGIFNCGGPTYPSWEGCDPQDEAYYNWGPSDAQFQSYLDGGFVPFLRLGGEWQNRSRNHDFKGPQNPLQEANWITAAHKMAERYLHWGGADQTFTYLDIWTEFPGAHFWDRGNKDFVDFWVAAYASLKADYPELKVGGPGFGAGETMKVIAGEARWSHLLLTELYDQGLKLDWLGWHLFNNDPGAWAQAAAAYRQLLDGAGPYADVPWAGTGYFTDTETIVDAYGLSTRNVDGSPLPVEQRVQLNSGAQGASILTAAWIAMQYADIERAYYYRGSPFSGEDNPQQRGGEPGLFDSQGGYKPSAYAFRLWSQVCQNYSYLLQVDIPSANPDIPLWVLAAQDDLGNTALLVSNPTAEAVAWGPQFADGRTLVSFRQAQVYQVDDKDDGLAAASLSLEAGAVVTPPYTVQLIVLAPQ